MRVVPLAWLLGVLAVAVGLSTAKPDTSESPSSTLVQWLAAQTNLQTWSADVTQVRSLKTLAQPLTARGQVWFAAPNRFRWELREPSPTIAVRQPEQLLVIYPKLKRAERFPLQGPQAGPWKETMALLEAGFPRSQAQLQSRFVSARDEVNRNDGISPQLEEVVVNTDLVDPEKRLPYLREHLFSLISRLNIRRLDFRPRMNRPRRERFESLSLRADACPDKLRSLLDQRVDIDR